jgi:outer membrane murein-binding lipoprotein Lpp
MKRFTALLLAVITTALLLAGCGVPQDDYDSLVSQKDGLQAEYSALKAEHDALVADTADWLAMSDDEKAAATLQAEMDRIAAEEAAKIAAEEQAAAEQAAQVAADEQAKREAAEARRKAAEAERDSVTLFDLLLEPEKYEGKFVRVTSTLDIISNDTSYKIFYTWLYTKEAGSDSNFYMYVSYAELPDWKTWGTVSSDQHIKVSGTFSDRTIQATEITLAD